MYSKKRQTEWIKAKPFFANRELLIKSYPVMQRWEDNYMKSLAAIATSGGGNVLEVGFGLGISAKYIERSKKVKLHTVIECHPSVIAFAKKLFREELKSGHMKLIKGFWEDVTPNMPNKSFDGILFDTSPLECGVDFFHFFPFFREAFRLLKDDGVFTYFSDEATEISELHLVELRRAGFKNIRFKICKVHPPKTCKYWKHRTIISPIIKKT